ncbi:ABC transporter substrate-binding protein [Plantactinospora mayteni]|uniref:Peptide ABC transporter substrate-binding protein n=1 Tax=Plantactinospora mayteni TaxID=566021 RepID=A0ABQ4EKK4_9ACTN|nr:ABC transporter substrate-binding protein [Plantactinospora mayteni]GIG95290.1 peptide ABC transporter substrate-binding protein [Plantactinospora mayteni]
MRPTLARRLLAALATAALAVGVTAGCGDDGDRSSAAEGKIINVFSGANAGFVPNFNPFSQNSVAGTMSVLYESLLYFNAARADDVQPQLATGYEFADDGRRLNLTIREGVKWSDGTPFSAEDVAFTFNLIRDNPKINQSGLPIVEAVATDPTHASITFSQGVYTQLNLIAGRTWIVPKHLWTTIPDPSAFTNEKPVGTGAFTLASFSQQNYVFERNPNYWETGKPKIKGMRFHQFASADSAIAALAAGQLDWAGSFIADIDKQYVSKDPEHNKYINESQLYLTNLIPNLERAPFDSAAVRKAISLALDRDQLIRLAFSGYGKEASPAQLPRPLWDDYIKPEYRDRKLEFDPARAEQTLQQDGWAKGADGIYAKAGRRLSFTVKVVQGYNDYISALQIMTQSLKSVGIELKTQEISFTAFSTDQQTGDFDVIMTNLYSEGTPYSWYSRAFSTARTAPLGQQAGSNYGRFRNAAVDAALLAMETTPPEAKDAIREQLFKIQDVIMEELPYIPIQQSSSLIEYRTENLGNFPTEQNHYALTTPYNGPDMGIVAKNLTPAG